MKILRSIGFAFFLLLFVQTLNAQIENPVTWKFSYKQVSDNKVEVYADAIIESGWHLYSAYLPDGGPVATTLKLKDSEDYRLVGKVIEEPIPEKKYDNSFQMDLAYFGSKARLIQTVELVGDKEKLQVKGDLEFMVCDDERCLPPEVLDFDLDIEIKTENNSEVSEKSKPGIVQQNDVETLDKHNKSEDVSEIELVEKVEKKDSDVDSVITEDIVETVKDEKVPINITEEHESYWAIFFLAFLGGFAALLTPCVFPMIPMTVSFFTKQSQNKAVGIRNALYYGISIIVIYVVLGVAVTAIFGADSLNALSTNPIFNLFFALLLIVFAISFFGAFEIVLPSSWVNAADKKADKGGLIGIFFMAFTLALVSFSCTGPIVGSLIVQAAREGGMAPVVGMLGFSSAIAIPFFFFAAFPGYLNSLPKSGGWLNSVKVVLGFLELAFAFKFLSVADMVLDLHWLEREVFIAIWIAIFGGLGFYLMGAIKLPHDSPMERLPVSRFLLGILAFAFTIYMIPGLWGAPVKLISGFPPSKEYAESPFGVGNDGPTGKATLGHGESLTPQMHYGPQGIPAFDDYDHALEYAKKVNKPLLLDFTGKGCVNCRKMEDNVWSNTEVKNLISDDFILVSLYVDLRKDLPESEQYISPTTGKKIKTVGNKWSDFQITRYNRNSQPHYVILDHDEKELVSFKAYDLDIDAYADWLKEGLENFNK